MLLYHGSNMVIDEIDLAVAYVGITFQYAFCTPLAISKLKRV